VVQKAIPTKPEIRPIQHIHTNDIYSLFTLYVTDLPSKLTRTRANKPVSKFPNHITSLVFNRHIEKANSRWSTQHGILIPQPYPRSKRKSEQLAVVHDVNTPRLGSV
jgi:hypothetical protein